MNCVHSYPYHSLHTHTSSPLRSLTQRWFSCLHSFFLTASSEFPWINRIDIQTYYYFSHSKNKLSTLPFFCSNFLLPFRAKLFKRIVYTHSLHCFLAHSFFDLRQPDFLPQHSTSTAAATVAILRNPIFVLLDLSVGWPCNSKPMLLKAKEGAINNFFGITWINWGHPRKTLICICWFIVMLISPQ